MPTYTRSTRSCRGAGWHKKGYRDNGYMWLNVKRAYCVGPFTRGADFNENETMEELIRDLARDITMEEGANRLPEGCYWDFQAFRGKSLLSEQFDPQARISDYFDGGEMIHAKAFDSQGQQVVYDLATGWQYR